jgi:hypothetical protein
LFYVGIASQTPCFSEMSNVVLVPATTPNLSGLTIQTNSLYARRYDLAPPPNHPPNHSKWRTIFGVVIGCVVVGAITVLAGYCLLRWKVRKAHKTKTETTPPQVAEMSVPGPVYPLYTLIENEKSPPNQPSDSLHELNGTPNTADPHPYTAANSESSQPSDTTAK